MDATGSESDALMNLGPALFLYPGVKVRPCQWGMGVFTDTFIAAGELIEECHYLKVPQQQFRGEPLDDYVFEIRWHRNEEPREGDWVALVMGYGMIYNHSSEPNASYSRAEDLDVFRYHALRDIHPGEQICISYGENWWKARGEEVPP
ncbi:SET domain-containing protein-lysine N-methyltransferase [Corallococcus exiguus]|uniref:SET domain-containing protein-lysine N-methyltransferase n=1 Tax=Corallococcus exiguus TaxID=83462 RepID=UPI002152F0AD|nr:SET domain-containing protein-lysine N-methyltransferase [Corallococcus exiguus]